MSNIVHVPENTRFYHRDGRPCFEVPSADGKKMVTPDIRHAKKLGLLESVTSILSLLNEPYLDQWKIEQRLLLSLANPKDPQETPEVYVERICRMGADVVGLKADRGKELHTAIEKGILGIEEPKDPAAEVALKAIRERIAAHCSLNGAMEIRPEGTFANASLGFAGRYDIRLSNEKTRVYLDVKTTDISKFKKPYPKWGLQGGAYLMGDDAPVGSKFEQVVVDRDTGETRFAQWGTEDTILTIAECQRAFCGLLEARFALNRYDPREV